MLYSRGTGRFVGGIFSTPQRYILHAWAASPYTMRLHVLEASGTLWKLGRPCKWRSILKSPLNPLCSLPPGVFKVGATGLQEAPLWSTTVPLAVPCPSLCVGGWKQGSHLPSCTGLGNPIPETAVLAGQAAVPRQLWQEIMGLSLGAA